MRAKRGRVSYGSRAFHQDATEAMGGDIVRALIETITNSDDAYATRPGKIKIEIEHSRGPWKVVTRDRATGMSASRMEDAIAHLGGRTSGFEDGADVRGNLGRGSKDLAAFGPVRFESICEDQYTSMLLDPDGNPDVDDAPDVVAVDFDLHHPTLEVVEAVRALQQLTCLLDAHRYRVVAHKAHSLRSRSVVECCQNPRLVETRNVHE